MIRIALLHASRGRPYRAFHPVHEWLGKADHPEEIEYIIGMDDDDTTISEYHNEAKIVDAVKRYGASRLEISVGETTSLIGCFNRLPKELSDTTQLIFCISDDSGCPRHWDTLIWEQIPNVNPYTEVKFIGVWDGKIDSPQADGTEHDAFWVSFIVTRAWYTKHKYLMCPEYRGPLADLDNTGYVRSVDLTYGTHVEVKAHHLTFPHRWDPEQDDVSKRLHSEEEFKRGLEILENRKQRAFDAYYSPIVR